MNRRITKEESEWIRSALEDRKAEEGLDITAYVEQLSGLRVVDLCTCGQHGCHTVMFQNHERGKSIAIADGKTSDGRWIIVCCHEESELLSELEVVPFG